MTTTETTPCIVRHPNRSNHTPETTTETFIERVATKVHPSWVNGVLYALPDDDDATAQVRALGEFLTEERLGLFAVDVELLDQKNAPAGVDTTEPRYKNALLYTVRHVSEDGFIGEVREHLASLVDAWPDAVLKYIYANYNNCPFGETVLEIDNIIDEFQFFPDIARLREFCVEDYDDPDDDDWKRWKLIAMLDDGNFALPEEGSSAMYSHGCFLAQEGGGFLVQAWPVDDRTFASGFPCHDINSYSSIEAVATRAALRLKSPAMTGLYPPSFRTSYVWGTTHHYG